MTCEWNSCGDRPRVSRGAYIHPTAVLAGNVHVSDDVFVGPHAILRADEPGPDGSVAPIAIGAGANVQDGVIIHALGGTGVHVGPGSTIAHGAVIHGPCRIGTGCFVGFKSVVYACELGDGVAVMHGCLVEKADVPSGRIVSSGATVREPDDVRALSRVDDDTRRFMDRVRDTNVRLARWRLDRRDVAR